MTAVTGPIGMFGAMQGISSAEINQLLRDGAVLD
jgi:hypothetical protein